MRKIKILLAALSRLENNFYEPLGIECLAGHLKASGLPVDVKMFYARNDNEILMINRQIEAWQPDVVGLSLFFDTLDFLHKIMPMINRLPKKPKIILGNILASFNSEKILNQYPDVFICLGSGEITICKFIEHAFGNKPISRVPGIAYKNNSVITRTKIVASPIAKPERIFLKDIRKYPAGRIYLEASRGCPYRCGFCQQNQFFGYKRIEKSKKELIGDITFLAKKTNGKILLLDFVDEDLLAGDKTALRAASSVQKLKEKRILSKETRIMCSVSVRSVLSPNGKNSLKKLAAAGLDRVFMGAESFSFPQLKRLGKAHTPDEIFQAIEILKKEEIKYELGFIMFEPETSPDDILLNCEGIRKTYSEAWISNPLHQWRALRGTAMCRRLAEDGFVIESYDPDWLTCGWKYKNASVAKIVKRAKNIERRLIPVELAVKKIYRSEEFRRLTTRSQEAILRWKKSLNIILIEFLEKAVKKNFEKKPIKNTEKESLKKAEELLKKIIRESRKDNALTSIGESAGAALFKNSGFTLMLPQDEPKKPA